MGTYGGFVRFIKSIFKEDPKKRPTVEKLLKHKFLADYVEEERIRELTEEEKRLLAEEEERKRLAELESLRLEEERKRKEREAARRK